MINLEFGIENEDQIIRVAGFKLFPQSPFSRNETGASWIVMYNNFIFSAKSLGHL